MTNLDQTFSALSDSTRRAIVARLVHGEASLSSVAEPFEVSQTAISKHVRVLADAGLVRVTKRGRTRYCALTAEPMKQAIDWLTHYENFWRQRFDALARHLEEES